MLLLGDRITCIAKNWPSPAILGKFWGRADDKQRTASNVATQSGQGDIDGSKFFRPTGRVDKHYEER